MTRFLAGLGCTIQVAISATRVRGLDRLPTDNIFVGDLEDLENKPREAICWWLIPTDGRLRASWG